jgi:hypothetical protein
MPPKSFAHEVLKSSAGDIYQIKAADKNDRIFILYLLTNELQKVKLEALIKSKSADEIDFSEYGKVITTCYGRYPTEEARKLLKNDFGVIV